jgi:hypothetical protein
MAILGVETSISGRNRFGWWLSGFTDAEGTFSITKYQGKARKDGNRCPSGYTFEFSIQLRNDDLEILEQIKDYLKVGGLLFASRKTSRRNGRVNDRDQVSFKVRDFDSIINTVIPHFDKFPLLSKKNKDYQLFKEAALAHKAYLDNGGSFHKWGNTTHSALIEDYRLRLNSGRKEYFDTGILYKSPYLDLVNKEQFSAWFAGFVDGDGCFGGYFGKGDNPSIGFKFLIHLREDDRYLLEAMKDRVGCGYIRYKPRCKSSTKNAKPHVSYEITSAEDCHTYLLPIFREFVLRAKKYRDCLLFDEAVSLLVKAQSLRKNKYTECRTQEEKAGRQYIRGLVTQLRLIKEYV